MKRDRARLKDFKEAARAEPVLVLPADLSAEEAVSSAVHAAGIGARLMVAMRLDLVRRAGRGAGGGRCRFSLPGGGEPVAAFRLWLERADARNAGAPAGGRRARSGGLSAPR